eukprot:scaffold64853_cov65-Phaeocystis_antarctica.AAC.4
MVAMMLVRLSAWSPKASAPRTRVSSNHASAFSRVVARMPGPCTEHSSATESSKVQWSQKPSDARQSKPSLAPPSRSEIGRTDTSGSHVTPKRWRWE